MTAPSDRYEIPAMKLSISEAPAPSDDDNRASGSRPTHSEDIS